VKHKQYEIDPDVVAGGNGSRSPFNDGGLTPMSAAVRRGSRINESNHFDAVFSCRPSSRKRR
jgi:hypothetical protein